MRFSVRVIRTFTAWHQLRLYDGSMEPRHAHEWRVELTVSAERLDSIGVVTDFHELERRLDPIVQAMHNRHLNDLPAFASRNPSAENVAVHVAESLQLPAPLKLSRVEVWEIAGCSAIYRP